MALIVPFSVFRLLAATPAQLRQTYRDFLGDGEPLTSYEEWIALYGFESRTRVVDFIEHAMGADMYALDPSCSRLEFGYLLQRVRQLTMLRSADYLLLGGLGLEPLALDPGFDRQAFEQALHQRAVAHPLIEYRACTTADRLLALYNGSWGGDISRVYETESY